MPTAVLTCPLSHTNLHEHWALRRCHVSFILFLSVLMCLTTKETQDSPDLSDTRQQEGRDTEAPELRSSERPVLLEASISELLLGLLDTTGTSHQGSYHLRQGTTTSREY